MHVHACAQEIVMYAYFKRLDYFSTECLYAPYAARGYARDFVKDLEVRQGVLLLYTIGSVFVSLVVYSWLCVVVIEAGPEARKLM